MATDAFRVGVATGAPRHYLVDRQLLWLLQQVIIMVIGQSLLLVFGDFHGDAGLRFVERGGVLACKWARAARRLADLAMVARLRLVVAAAVDRGVHDVVRGVIACACCSCYLRHNQALVLLVMELALDGRDVTRLTCTGASAAATCGGHYDVIAASGSFRIGRAFRLLAVIRGCASG